MKQCTSLYTHYSMYERNHLHSATLVDQCSKRKVYPVQWYSQEQYIKIEISTLFLSLIPNFWPLLCRSRWQWSFLKAWHDRKMGTRWLGRTTTDIHHEFGKIIKQVYLVPSTRFLQKSATTLGYATLAPLSCFGVSRMISFDHHKYIFLWIIKQTT